MLSQHRDIRILHSATYCLTLLLCRFFVCIKVPLCKLLCILRKWTTLQLHLMLFHWVVDSRTLLSQKEKTRKNPKEAKKKTFSDLIGTYTWQFYYCAHEICATAKFVKVLLLMHLVTPFCFKFLLLLKMIWSNCVIPCLFYVTVVINELL